jgi:pimeloyl-ACP methyl ester carboxylesterase
MTEANGDSRHIETPSGRIGYREAGAGPVALFVHGALLNSHLWRHQLAELSDIRRCIALDLLAHGGTEIAPGQDLSLAANAKMIGEFLDALKVDQIDLVCNDTGGAVAQIFAAKNPDRIRTLTLTDSDTQGNIPPEAFKPFLEMAAAGGLRQTFDAMLADPGVFRSEFAAVFEDPSSVSDEDVETFLRPLARTETRIEDFRRFLASIDGAEVEAIEPQLRQFEKPTAIIWGDDDIFFDVRCAVWLAETIPGTRAHVVLKGARLLFPWERSTEFNRTLRAFWSDPA